MVDNAVCLCWCASHLTTPPPPPPPPPPLLIWTIEFSHDCRTSNGELPRLWQDELVLTIRPVRAGFLLYLLRHCAVFILINITWCELLCNLGLCIHCNHDCYEACADICLLYCAHAFMHIYICDVYIMFLYMYIFSRLWRFENKQINGVAWNWSNSVKILLLVIGFDKIYWKCTLG